MHQSWLCKEERCDSLFQSLLNGHHIDISSHFCFSLYLFPRCYKIYSIKCNKVKDSSEYVVFKLQLWSFKKKKSYSCDILSHVK